MQPAWNDWNTGTWVLIWEYYARTIQWIPTQQGLDSVQKSLRICALDKSLSIGRDNKLGKIPYEVDLLSVCMGHLQTALILPSVPQMTSGIDPLPPDHSGGLTHSCQKYPKRPWLFWWKLPWESIPGKIFEREISIMTINKYTFDILYNWF